MPAALVTVLWVFIVIALVEAVMGVWPRPAYGPYRGGAWFVVMIVLLLLVLGVLH